MPINMKPMRASRKEILNRCKAVLLAYNSGQLGDTTMPEDSHPEFANTEPETRLLYFTLPMSLNYQRDSYKLWQAALSTYQDPETNVVFSLKESAQMDENLLREHLLKYKLALQPNKHINSWHTIAHTIYTEFRSMEGLFEASLYDFLKLRELMQGKHKKGFPYLSGPKIFNYWSYIIQLYGGIELKNSEFIDIAPDTHVIQASVRLGVISADEALKMSRDSISERWRELLVGSGILPIEMHSPLWFWSRGGFKVSD